MHIANNIIAIPTDYINQAYPYTLIPMSGRGYRRGNLTICYLAYLRVFTRVNHYTPAKLDYT